MIANLKTYTSPEVNSPGYTSTYTLSPTHTHPRFHPGTHVTYISTLKIKRVRVRIWQGTGFRHLRIGSSQEKDLTGSWGIVGPGQSQVHMCSSGVRMGAGLHVCVQGPVSW